MAKNLFSSILFFAAILYNASAQVDSAEILYSAKLQIASEGHSGDSTLWRSFFDRYKARFLQSTGFDVVSFVLIEKKELDDSLDATRRQWYENNNMFFECLYVVAFNPKTRLFYKLKGFRTSEIAEFKQSLDKYSSGSVGTFYFNLKGADESRYLRKELCFVESLDLECLRKYLKDKTILKGTTIYTRKETMKYPCIISCFYRDMRLQ